MQLALRRDRLLHLISLADKVKVICSSPVKSTSSFLFHHSPPPPAWAVRICVAAAAAAGFAEGAAAAGVLRSNAACRGL